MSRVRRNQIIGIAVFLIALVIIILGTSLYGTMSIQDYWTRQDAQKQEQRDQPSFWERLQRALK